jgi:EmrB/QacA subfamily drug resistance transporter
LAWYLLREDRPSHDSKKPFDIWGFAFLSVFLVAFLLGLSKGQEEGWTSVYIVTCAFLSLLGFVGFLVVESVVPNKVIDIDLFAHKDFSIAMIVTGVRSIALYGGTFLLPLFLQQLMGKDEIESGMVLLPGSLIIGVFMPIAGKMSDKIGPRLLTFVGLFMVGLFMLMYYNLTVEWSDWDVILPTIVRGIGIGLISAPVTAAALNAVPKHKAGMASSMMNLIQQVGGSIGIALLATILSNRTHFHVDHLGANFTGDGSKYLEATKNLFNTGKGLGLSAHDAGNWARALLNNELMKNAMSRAYQDAFIVGGLLVMLALIPALMLPNKGAEGEHEMMIME